MSPGAELARLQGCREEKEMLSWMFWMFRTSQLSDCGRVWRPWRMLCSSCSRLLSKLWGQAGQVVLPPVSSPAGETERTHPCSEEQDKARALLMCCRLCVGSDTVRSWGWGVAEAGLQSPLIAVHAALHSGAANLPPSVCSSFLIAFLTSLLLFCWQCPEARSPPGALALACQN